MKVYANQSLHGNKILESLSVSVAQDSFCEVTRSFGLVSSIIYWTTPLKTQKIREIIYTRSGNLISAVQSKQYDEQGTLVRTYTETYTRTGGLITSVTGVET